MFAAAGCAAQRAAESVRVVRDGLLKILRFAGVGVVLLGAAYFFGRGPAAADSPPGSAPGPAGMARIPPGTFVMGCTAGDTECRQNEKPAHRVVLRGFYLDARPVTIAEYERVMETKTDFAAARDCPTCPAAPVPWKDAQTYCAKLGKRLPTEAEWEYAARAGSPGPRYGELEAIAWCALNSGGRPHPAGEKQPNAWGLYDMFGNVFQWCADWFDDTYYESSPKNNPTGPGSGLNRVTRGGCWFDDAKYLRASARSASQPDLVGDGVGFRCARDEAPVESARAPAPADQSLPRAPAAARPAAPPAPAASTAAAGSAAGMIRIPGGAFTMGCAPGDLQCSSDEKPAHRTTISGFLMDEHPVTVSEYQQCVQAGACQQPAASGDAASGPHFNWGNHKHLDHPVNGVDWNDSAAYCAWRGKRLPTEAEYEYALRGGLEKKVFPWGDSGMPPPRYGNYADETAKRETPSRTIFLGYDDKYAGTSPVCAMARNFYGLCDISGNVWEYCSDRKAIDYYATSPLENPKGPTTTRAGHVIRGGSWKSGPRAVRASCRGYEDSATGAADVGFRCVRDVAPAAAAPEISPEAAAQAAAPADLAAMVKIPAGSFTMGCSPGDAECFDAEQPPHRVTLDAFWLDATPVTNAQYRKCAATGACKPSSCSQDPEWNGPNQPVVCVDWAAARDYCRWAGKRLPTEAEWEYAARAGSTGPRYGKLDAIAWYARNAGGATHAVGARQPNSWGLYDMLGNVWQWCADWFDEGYYASSTANNPPGPFSGTTRALRGGCWYFEPRGLRVSNRFGYPPQYAFNNFGFRCAKNN
jgi:formylglycine-generating enzyme required for sulfatase activity